MEMPLLDSSYLPSTIFILTHVLGIAGVLYWKRCARGRAGNVCRRYSLNLLWALEGGVSDGGLPSGLP